MPVLPTIVFDAVGTLIRPRESISGVYRRFALRHGLQLDQPLVKQRFVAARQKIFSNDREQRSSESLEKQRWTALVADVFCEMQDTSALFKELWQYYAEPENWLLFSEVPTCLEALWQAQYPICIASNFDVRLLAICQNLPPLNRIQKIFYSGDIGFSKPDPRFYQEIERRLGNGTPLMIGDDPEKDVRAAESAGWQARHLDRPRLDLSAALRDLI